MLIIILTLMGHTPVRICETVDMKSKCVNIVNLVFG